MALTANFIIASIMLLFLFLAIPVIIFFAIRALIRYNARMKAERDQVAQELDRMNIEDL